MNIKCPLCMSTDVKKIHEGVRDDKNIDVLRCNECDMVFLSRIESDLHKKYVGSKMHQGNYNQLSDSVKDVSWNEWIKITEGDDFRRSEELKSLCAGKKILDFGCGNGGFLRNINGCAEEIKGVEIEESARINLTEEGIEVENSLDEFEDNYFDVITSFQVIEHLPEPEIELKKMYRVLKPKGVIIIETPNADDALISFYQNEAFKDFTFWSKHVRLYNSKTLNYIMQKEKFKILKDGQIQRYPISNHLYWLAKCLPGGHMKWDVMDSEELNKAYEDKLRDLKMCDTLFSIYQK